MKQLLLILLLASSVRSFSQEVDLPEIDGQLTKPIMEEFNIRFKGIEEKNSFKLLREFLKEKESLLEALKEKRNDYEPDTTKAKLFRAGIVKMHQLVKGKKDVDTVELRSSLAYLTRSYFSGRFRDSTVKRTVAEINEITESSKDEILEIQESFEKFSIIQTSITNVNNDIIKCTTQIDSALAPEYQQQNFRKIISISFSVLIGLLLIIFFSIVYKRSDITLSRDLLSGNGLQFITLFVLIIAVILFGILNILQSSELAAILSGISGYILGKGTQKDLTSIMSGGSAIPPVAGAGGAAAVI